ncbi:MAG TPA: CDP-alcohol phosphatidyltransferase family protein [Solirubrobacterales bacterium]|nr:CDP-alcohol phosphatidyltransferase family protein [Solirubrobacterales bacterium]
MAPEEPSGRKRLSRKRLLGFDRSGPEHPATRAGQPLRPFTIPNLIGYIRLAAIPVFLVISFDSGDGRDPTAAILFFAIAFGDLLDGFVARATGQYSRLGALLDPVVDRLTILSGAIVCWHFDLLPHWALAALAVREVATLILAQMGLRKGADIEINWIGRIAVFLIMGGIFWSLVLDWEIIRIGFSVGVVIAIVATVMYARAARLAIKAKAAEGAEKPA